MSTTRTLLKWLCPVIVLLYPWLRLQHPSITWVATYVLTKGHKYALKGPEPSPADPADCENTCETDAVLEPSDRPKAET